MYLTQKYGMGPALAEHAYSLVEAIEAYAYDADIQLFNLVLRHELSEDVHEDQDKSIQKLIEACVAMEKQENKNKSPSKSKLVLEKKVFVQVLMTQFPYKSPSDMRMLVKVRLRLCPFSRDVTISTHSLCRFYVDVGERCRGQYGLL